MATDKACCFFGHRKINETPELIERLTKEIAVLIIEKEVSTFYFGSKSQFDDLCYKVVTELKTKHPHIKRVYVRSAFQHIPDWYEDGLLEHYEDTYFPKHMENAGRASYVERNQEMINKAHERGIKCNVFWSDDAKETKEFLRMGIDTILTNDYHSISLCLK